MIHISLSLISGERDQTSVATGVQRLSKIREQSNGKHFKNSSNLQHQSGELRTGFSALEDKINKIEAAARAEAEKGDALSI